MKSRKPFDVEAFKELNIYTFNDRKSYIKQDLLKENYRRKLKRGAFERSRAEQGILNLVVTPAARQYAKEFGTRGSSRYMFGMPERKAVAKSIFRDMWREHLR